jgi:hypothetical protein
MIVSAQEDYRLEFKLSWVDTDQIQFKILRTFEGETRSQDYYIDPKNLERFCQYIQDVLCH